MSIIDTIKQFLIAKKRTLSEDENFVRLLHNGLALFTSNTFVTGLQFFQVIVLTRLLLPDGYGIFTLILAYVLLVNQFLDVRVAETTVKFGSEYISQQKYQSAAAIIKLSYLVDFGTGLLAFFLVYVTASWTAVTILHQPDVAALVQLYAITLLISTTDNTSSAVLRIFDRFEWLSKYGAVMAVLEFTAVTLVAFLGGGIRGVLLAMIGKDFISAIVNTALSITAVHQVIGFNSFRQSPMISLRPRFRELGRFVFHTNFMAYFRMINTKVDVLLLGYFWPPAEVGVYKFARQLSALIGQVSTPFFSAILPDLSRLWAQKRIVEFRQLIRRITISTALLLIPAGIAIMLLAEFLIRLVSGDEFMTAVPMLRIGVWAFITGGIFFWTWPAALSVQKPQYGTTIGLIVIIVQMLLSVLLVPTWGGIGSIVALLAAYLVGQPLLAWLVFKVLSETKDKSRPFQVVEL